MSDSQSGVRWYYLANEWTNNIAAVTALEVDGQTYTAEAIVAILRQSRQPDADLATARRLIAEAEARAQAAEADAAALRDAIEGLMPYAPGGTPNELPPLVYAAVARVDEALEGSAGVALLAELEAARTVVAIARRGFGTAADVLQAEAFDPVALTHAIERYDAARGRAGAEREGK